MTQQSYQVGQIQLDRSEMFALGAAAGAVLSAAISEYLERRRPKTAWERAQERGAEALSAVTDTAKLSTQRAKDYVDVASDYVQEVIEGAPKTWQQTKKQAKKGANKRSKQARKQAVGLKEAAVAALGVTAVSGVADKVRDYASSAAERVVGDPYAVSGSIKETLKERYDSARGITSDSNLTERALEVGGTALETIKSVAATAADTVKDYTSTARETLKDAELGDKAKDYSALVADTVKDYATTARETLKDAELGDKAKDYATAATAALTTYSVQASKATRKAAKQSASKLTESATYLADVTTEQASDLRKGVKKGVTRTRRRARWGFRAFAVGIVIGFLAAPQSGQNTRDAVLSFIENILDVIMPEGQSGSTASL